jgi:hypothetical protein
MSKTTQAEYDAMLKAWYEANKDPDAQMAALYVKSGHAKTRLRTGTQKEKNTHASTYQTH